MTEPLCTCGKRPKHKCCEESGVGGKMCLKEFKDLDRVVTVSVNVEVNNHYQVYVFDMWMKFNSQHDYLDWQDTLRKP